MKRRYLFIPILILVFLFATVSCKTTRERKIAEAKSRQKEYHAKFKQRAKADQQIYSAKELADAEKMYQKANGNGWRSDEAKQSLSEMIEKYPKANRAGCGTLYLAQWAEDEEMEGLLQKAIDKYNDSYYGDGVQVGAYARYFLADYYVDLGQFEKSNQLWAELKTKYPDAIDHKGFLLADFQPTDAQNKFRYKFIKRAEADLKTYTKEQMHEAENMYRIANGKGWETQEAKKSLEQMIEKYPDCNRAGCGTLYLAQWAEGRERERLLKKAIEKYNDSFYGDGVQVGAYARLLLAIYYEDEDQNEMATKLYDELKSDFPDAINHKGKPITQM